MYENNWLYQLLTLHASKHVVHGRILGCHFMVEMKWYVILCR